jgi:hypothetical protein
VGGGYPEKQNGATLAKVPLAWMLREAVALGLRINDAQRQYLMDSRGKPPPDACGPIHESLAGFWTAMEYLPRRSWDSATKRMQWQSPHCGRRRPITPGPVVHISVVERMKRLNYSPGNLPGNYTVEE